jgi:hypothetical protein
MSEHVIREVDRSKWKRGEWDSEPDRVDFVHAGYACFLLRGPVGSWCGYVGVPNTHPAYGVEYNNYDHPVSNLDVHGGLTYSDKCGGAICHVPEPGMPDDVWWFGFDTAHHMDITPMEFGFMGHGTYKNVEYVTNEVQHLADQLQALEKK